MGGSSFFCAARRTMGAEALAGEMARKLILLPPRGRKVVVAAVRMARVKGFVF